MKNDRTLILTPSEFEGEHLPAYLPAIGTADDLAAPVAWGVCGIGRACAGTAERMLAQAPATRVILAGFAGGLDPDIQPGAIYRWDIDDGWPGEVLCSKTIIATAADKAAAHRETGARFVEMEGEWLIPVIKKHGARYTMIRTVSDTAAEIFPQPIAAAYDFAKQKPTPHRFFLSCLRHPTVVPEVVRLLKRWSKLKHELAQALKNEVETSPGPASAS